MNTLYYIGRDNHKKTITYCVKRIDGTLVQQSTVDAERKDLPQSVVELMSILGTGLGLDAHLGSGN